MMGINIAIRAFFAALFQRDVALKIQYVLNDSAAPTQKLPTPSPISVPSTPTSATQINLRSGAIELLAALQRDARFIDFIKEDLRSCDEATLGAAARMVHDSCAETLERFFEIRPLSTDLEGDSIMVESVSIDPARTRIVGCSETLTNGSVSCRVAHAGWIAQKCELPLWTGKAEDAFVLAPVELETKTRLT